MPPAHNTTEGVGRPPKPPLQTVPWTHPTLESNQENLLSVLTPPAAAGPPVKPCLNYFSGSDQFLLIGEAKNPASVTSSRETLDLTHTCFQQACLRVEISVFSDIEHSRESPLLKKHLTLDANLIPCFIGMLLSWCVQSIKVQELHT